MTDAVGHAQIAPAGVLQQAEPVPWLPMDPGVHAAGLQVIAQLLTMLFGDADVVQERSDVLERRIRSDHGVEAGQTLVVPATGLPPGRADLGRRRPIDLWVYGRR